MPVEKVLAVGLEASMPAYAFAFGLALATTPFRISKARLLAILLIMFISITMTNSGISTIIMLINAVIVLLAGSSQLGWGGFQYCCIHFGIGCSS
jgi:Sec-independent protein secretion pathway component TatC